MSEPCDESSSVLNDSLRPTLGELNMPIQEDWDFGELGVDRLEWMLEPALRTTTKKGLAEAAKCDGQLLYRLLHNPEEPKRPKRLSRQLLRQLAGPLGDALCNQDGNEGLDNEQAVEIDLNLHSGQLPGQILELQSEANSKSLLMTIRDIINTVHLRAQNSAQACLNVEYWLKEMSTSARNWNALMDFATMWGQSGDWAEVQKLWNRIQRGWTSMSNVQRGFAVVLRSRTLTVRGLTQDAHALLEVAQSQFPEEAVKPSHSPSRAIRFMLYTTWGNVYREAGSVNDAIKMYDRAGEYAATSAECFSLKRKQFNAYLRIAQDPPHGLVEELERALRTGIQDMDANATVPLSVHERAYTCYALAWYYRNIGLRKIEDALQFNWDGLHHLESYGDPTDVDCQHALSVGHQYLADKLMRDGQFEEAYKEVGKSRFGTIHQARRATGHFLSGRSIAFHALATGDLHFLDIAIEELEKADRFFSMMGIGQRRQQALNELGKFYATRAALNGPERWNVDDINNAGSSIELARTILDALGTYEGFDRWAVEINCLIVQFLEWITVEEFRKDKTRSQIVHKRVQDLDRQLKTDGMAGHQARVSALLAAVRLARYEVTYSQTENTIGMQGPRLKSGKKWKDLVVDLIGQSARLASQWDWMALYECRWYISLGGEKSIYSSLFGLRDALAEFDRCSGNRIPQAPTGAWASNV